MLKAPPNLPAKIRGVWPPASTHFSIRGWRRTPVPQADLARARSIRLGRPMMRTAVGLADREVQPHDRQRLHRPAC